MYIRNRTPSNIIGYGLYLYFLGLSFRNTSKALSFLKIARISHVSIWSWIQKYKPWKYLRKRKINEYIIDETAIKAGSSEIWLWIIIEPKHKEILAIDISKERNMFVADWFLSTNIGVWNTIRFVRWCYMVSSSMQIFESISSSSLLFWKKHNWKDDEVHKR